MLTSSAYSGVTAVTINTRPIALHPRRSNLNLVDVDQRGPPRGFREQGNMAIYFWGTRDILKLLLGNKGTFEYFSGTREL